MSSQPNPAQFTLIIADSAKLLADESFAAKVPSLARLAGRGRVREIEWTRAQYAWTAAELSMLHHCGLVHDIERFPSAAMCAIGTSEASTFTQEARGLDDVCWAHADAVHFSAGLNDLAGLQLRDQAKVTDDEHIALSECLRSHLGTEGELVSLRSGKWLLKFPYVMRAQTQAPQHAFRGPLQEALPSGPNGAQLRRLMTELQMVIHDDAVNRARARQGLPAINAMWIWGLGEMPAAQATRALPKAYGSSAFLKGLYLVHGKTVQAGDAALEEILKEGRSEEPVLAVIDEVEPSALQTGWFAPLERALRAGRIKSVAIDFDRWRIAATRAESMRFWRRDWNFAVQAL